ncbi:MAG: hypothetical protein AAF267_15135 [Deinococcota bacterium]
MNLVRTRWCNLVLLAFVSSLCVTVIAAAQDLSNSPIVIKGIVGPEGDVLSEIIHTDFFRDWVPAGAVALGVYEGALMRPEPIQLVVSNENVTTYPELDELDDIYSPDGVRPIGPLVTFEVAMDAVNLEFSEETPVVRIVPLFYEGIATSVAKSDIRIEIRLHRADGEVTFLTQRFDGTTGVAGSAVITSQFLQSHLGPDFPEILKITVQTVDVSEALPNPLSPLN